MLTANEIKDFASAIIKNCVALAIDPVFIDFLDIKVVDPYIDDNGIQAGGGFIPLPVTGDGGFGGFAIKIVNTELEGDKYKVENRLFTILLHELCHMKQYCTLLDVLTEKGFDGEDLFDEADAKWRHIHNTYGYWDCPLERQAYSFMEFGKSYERHQFKRFVHYFFFGEKI